MQALYGFFWNDFCDWYVEVSKAKLQAADTKANCLAIQDLVLRQTLLLLHPFIPFITEELWNQLGFGAAGTFLTRDARLDDASVLAERFRRAGESCSKGARCERSGLQGIRRRDPSAQGNAGRGFAARRRGLSSPLRSSSRLWSSR